MSEPTATNIIAGPALIYVAPVTTTPPAVTGSSALTWPPTWSGSWKPLGYTDKGVDLLYTPTVKPYTPDEETSPVYDILEAEKAEISVVLSEGTLDNFQRAISASTLTDATTPKVRTLSVGSQPLNYLAIGFQGPSPAGPGGSGVEVPDGVICIFQKALSTAAVNFFAMRKGVRLYTVKWEARKIAGQDLFDVYEFYH